MTTIPINHKKELVSSGYLRALGLSAHYLVETKSYDFGIDLVFLELEKRKRPNGPHEYCNTGREIHAQVKAVKKSRFNQKQGTFKYPLRAKNYNDLASRQGSVLNPLILLLFVVPNNESDWVIRKQDVIEIRERCYYYVPSGLVPTKNKYTATIDIPIVNVFDATALDSLFQSLFSVKV